MAKAQKLDRAARRAQLERDEAEEDLPLFVEALGLLDDETLQRVAKRFAEIAEGLPAGVPKVALSNVSQALITCRPALEIAKANAEQLLKGD